MTTSELLTHIYENKLLFAAVVAILLPFVVIAAGFIINYLGYAIAFLVGLFVILGLTLVTLVMRYSPFYTYILLITIISRKNVV